MPTSVLKSGPFHFSVGLWPVAPLALDPGPAAGELAELLRRARSLVGPSVVDLARERSS